MDMSNDSGFKRHLIVDWQSQAMRDRLWQLIRDAKGSDILAPVTVVGPTRYANLSLRHELGRTGFANVRFLVLPALAELLGAAALAKEGRRPLTATLEGVSIRAALSEATGPLAPVRGHSSTQSSLLTSFRELRKASPDVLQGIEGQDGVRAEVVRLYQSFRQNISSDWYDVEDLAEAATEAVHPGDTPALDDLGLIIFYLPRDISPAETKLIEALVQRSLCAVLLGTTGDEDADEPALALAKTLEPAFCVPGALVEDSQDTTLPPGEATLHIAPSSHEELRWVIRQIVQEAEARGTPFHRMAILYRAENPYATLIPDELALAGIPMAGPGRKSLAQSGAGRTLLGLLALAGGKFGRADVMAWLTGCPVRPPAGRTPRFNPSHWDSLSRKAGVVGGVPQWRDRLNRHAADLEKDARDRLNKDEINEARAERMRFEAAASRNAVAFVEKLEEDVRSPTDGSSWGAFCDWARKVLDIYLSHDLGETEETIASRIEDELEALRAADDISPSATLESFRQTVEESLNRPTGQLGPTGTGVFVSNLAAAAGMNFDAVWLVGMIEGAVPPAVGHDPLQLGLGSFREARARERYNFLSVLASAPRRTLSYPVADGASQRQAYPSRWFLEQASNLEGNQVHTGDLPKLRGRTWLTASDSWEQALSDTTETALADRHDYTLHRLLQWKHSGERVRHHPLVVESTITRGIRAGLNRNLRRFTEFDGNLSAMAASDQSRLGLAQDAVSATRLESWAKCPFSYFLGHVLRIGALDTPEETTSISALDRGDLVHRILESFVVREVQDGQLPSPGDAWGSEARERLFAICEATFRDAEERGVTGKHLLWQLAKQDIRDDLESFLEEESELRRSWGTGQVRVEVEFGASDATPAIIDPETQLRFRGKIDRLDISADGKSVLVIDYKTGSPSSYDDMKKDIIDGGRRLQLGVYSLAAQRLVTGADDVRAAYWFSTTRGGFRFAPPGYFDIADDEVGERFRAGVSAIAAGIREGVFPANPGPWVNFGRTRSGPKNCAYCDFDSLCPARRIDIWERKKSDRLLSGYQALSSDGEEE